MKSYKPTCLSPFLAYKVYDASLNAWPFNLLSGKSSSKSSELALVEAFDPVVPFFPKS
jgi:hypothetical protein